MARLNVGDKMPNFTFNTAYDNGKTVDGVVAGKKKTVFWVLRYIGCTVCRYDVHVIAQRYQEFQDKDAQVLVVMQSDPAVVREDLKETKLPFDIVCDTDMNIYKSLEIAPAASMEAMIGGDPSVMAKLQEKGAKAEAAGFTHGKYEGDEQQLPAMFIVNGEGVVEYAHYATNIMDMPTVDEVLAML